MNSALFAVCCTANIPTERISDFSKITYDNSAKMDCRPSLFLVTGLEDLKSPLGLAPTQPPVKSFEPPFLGKSIREIADVLQTTITNSGAICSNLFAVLDDRSCIEDDGLIVLIKNGGVDSVRVHFDTINAELIRTTIVTWNLVEVKTQIGVDGVFRTRPVDESCKGKPAPRKQLKAPDSV